MKLELIACEYRFGVLSRLRLRIIQNIPFKYLWIQLHI